MLGDDQLHAAGELVLALGDTDDLDAAVFQLCDDRAGFREVAAQAVILVNVEPVELAGFGIGQQQEQGFAAGQGPSAPCPVNVFPPFLPGQSAAARFDLDLDAGPAVLGVAAVPRVDCC